MASFAQSREGNKSSVAPSDSLRLQASPLWLRMGFWACTAIAVAAVIRHLIAFARPLQAGPPQLVTLDRLFASHAGLTLAHILPALAFVLWAPFLVFSKLEKRTSLDYVLYLLGVVVGITAYAMSGYAVGGWLERSAVLFFNSLFMLSLVRSYMYMRSGELVLTRLWLIRAVAILLGIATTRPVMGIFFATSRFTHLGPTQFFGIAFWIGFSINTLVVEVWLRRLRSGSTLTRSRA